MDSDSDNGSDQGSGGGTGQDRFFGPDQKTEVTLGRAKSYREVGRIATELWTLNKLQALALHLPLQFLDQQQQHDTVAREKQMRQYIGGEGGTGKTQVLHALKDVFRMKGEEFALEITTSSAVAACKIGGRTVHSAVGLKREEFGESDSREIVPGEEAAR
jgi:hypothetical protein